MVRQGQQKGKNRPDMSRQGKWQAKEQDGNFFGHDTPLGTVSGKYGHGGTGQEKGKNRLAWKDRDNDNKRTE
jgi:hypothetical protein